MEGFLERLKGGVLVADGAMGTMLQAAGLGVGEAPDLWNITHPDTVKNVHRLYKDAGADILLTNTFGSNRIKLEKADLAGSIEEINKSAVRLAKEIAEENCFVFGDVGPSGALLKPIGELGYNEAVDNFSEQISILKEAGADAIILETMIDLQELKAALSAAKKVKGIPIIGCMAFQKTKKGFRTVMGADINQAVKLMEEFDCDIIGSNCGVGIDEMTEIIVQMRKLTKTLIIAKPNAGSPEFFEGKTIFRQKPSYFGARTKDLINAGANIVGGCCGTTPEFIRQIKEIING